MTPAHLIIATRAVAGVTIVKFEQFDVCTSTAPQHNEICERASGVDVIASCALLIDYKRTSAKEFDSAKTSGEEATRGVRIRHHHTEMLHSLNICTLRHVIGSSEE